MSDLLDLLLSKQLTPQETTLAPTEQPSSKKRVLTFESLSDLMADIELKKRSDPKAVVTLLKDLMDSRLLDLQTVRLAKAEKFFRELASTPLSVFTTQKGDFELMKKMSRDLLRQWADRRQKELIMEELMSGRMQPKKIAKRAPTQPKMVEAETEESAA